MLEEGMTGGKEKRKKKLLNSLLGSAMVTSVKVCTIHLLALLGPPFCHLNTNKCTLC
jgi:hypothetical protein